MLKKDQFGWIEKVETTFEKLKKVMTIHLVLALPDYSQEFFIETNASSISIGVVLMQGGHPITYISKALSLKHQGLSIYENELLAIVHVVTKWHHYLHGRHFVI